MLNTGACAPFDVCFHGTESSRTCVVRFVVGQILVLEQELALSAGSPPQPSQIVRCACGHPECTQWRFKQKKPKADWKGGIHPACRHKNSRGHSDLPVDAPPSAAAPDAPPIPVVVRDWFAFEVTPVQTLRFTCAVFGR